MKLEEMERRMREFEQQMSSSSVAKTTVQSFGAGSLNSGLSGEMEIEEDDEEAVWPLVRSWKPVPIGWIVGGSGEEDLDLKF